MSNSLGQLTSPSTTSFSSRFQVPSPLNHGPWALAPAPPVMKLVWHDHRSPTPAVLPTLSSPTGRRVVSTVSSSVAAVVVVSGAVVTVAPSSLAGALSSLAPLALPHAAAPISASAATNPSHRFIVDPPVRFLMRRDGREAAWSLPVDQLASSW